MYIFLSEINLLPQGVGLQPGPQPGSCGGGRRQVGATVVRQAVCYRGDSVPPSSPPTPTHGFNEATTVRGAITIINDCDGIRYGVRVL